MPVIKALVSICPRQVVFIFCFRFTQNLLSDDVLFLGQHGDLSNTKCIKRRLKLDDSVSKRKIVSAHSTNWDKKRISGESSYSNRGMTLEADLNETNQYYLVNGIAVIHKKPTPVQIVNVDYPKEVLLSLKKPILNNHPQQTITGCTKAAISILKQRKPKALPRFRSKISTTIKLSI